MHPIRKLGVTSMRTLGVIFFTVACLGLISQDGRAANDASNERVVALFESLSSKLDQIDPTEIDSATLEELFHSFAKTLESNSTIALLLEHPRIQMSWKGDIGAIWKFTPQARVLGPLGEQKVGLGTFMKVSLCDAQSGYALQGPEKLKFEVGIKPGKNAVTGEITIPQLIGPRRTLDRTGLPTVNPIFGIELNYANPEDYLTLLGFSSKDLPGGGLTKDMLDYATAMVSGHRTPSVQGRHYGGMIDAVLAEVRDAIAPRYLITATQFDEYTATSGVKL